jgi:tetratricopeptide (TPR) repeat protein
MRKRQQFTHPRKDSRSSWQVWRLAGARNVRLLLTAVVLVAGIVGFCLARVLWRADSPTALVDTASPVQPEIQALQEEAMQVADGLRKDFPDSTDPLVLMGNLHNTMGHATEAMECWQQSLEMDPGRADAYRGLGSLAMRRGQYEKALELWRKALEIKPEMAGVRTLSARALMALGRPKEAIAALQKDLQISPSASTSYFELGQAYRQLKEYDKAKENYRAATKIQPDYTNAYYGLALACERLGQKDEFAAYMEQFKRLKAQNRLVEKDLRSTYDDVDSARRSVAQTHTEAGEVYYGHDNLQKAEQHWKEAARLDPKSTACRMQLVRLYTQDGRDREALQICEELSQIEPGNATTYLNIGVLNARLNRLDAALAAVERAVALDPNNPACQRARQLIQERRRRDGLGN